MLRFDEADLRVLSRLARDGRASWADLAGEIGLSPPAIAERVRNLQERGVILGFGARLDSEAIGRGTAAFVSVTLARPEHRAGFLRWVQGADDVLECHHVAGEGDYLLKVRVAGLRRLETMISLEIKSIPGVAATRTTIVLSSEKEEALTPPLPPPARASSGHRAKVSIRRRGRKDGGAR